MAGQPISRTAYDDETIEKEGLISGTASSQEPPRPRWRCIPQYLVALFVTLQTFIIIAMAIYIGIQRRRSDLSCATQLSPYSPYLESGDLQYKEFTEENHLMQPSPYRGRPTLEVEEAWLKLWRLPTIHFPEEKMKALNKTPAENYAHVSEKDGGDILGFLNVFHQLHCLNLVRQYTYRDEYDFSNVTAFRAPDELVRGHVDHCIETIRKSLVCTSDVTPVVFIKDQSRASGSKSDFNLRRKCRDFRRIQEWAIKNRGSV